VAGHDLQWKIYIDDIEMRSKLYIVMDRLLCFRNNGQRRLSKQNRQKGEGKGRGGAEDAEKSELADQPVADLNGQSPASSFSMAVEPSSKAAFSTTSEEAETSAGTLPGPKKKPWSAGTIQARAEEAVKRGPSGATLEWLEAESDEGNVEYKLRLKDPSTMRFQQLVLNHIYHPYFNVYAERLDT